MSSSIAADPVKTVDQFKSGGKAIRVETFAGGDENAPSILVLHGATGVEYANRFIAVMAQAFAAQGFNVHLIHYFDRTGVQRADDALIRRSSDAWLEAVADAVEFVHRKHPHAAIGVFGYSLGGYLAAAESVKNDRVTAAVVLAGGLDEASAGGVRHAPPMLILHGSADSRVPLSEARRLETAVTNAGVPPEVHIYPGEGHIMKQETYTDVIRRGSEFFRAHLAVAAP